MPYEKWTEVPPSLQGIEPKISLAQANLIATWADEIEQSDADVESPWAVAIANFKKAFTVEDEAWVKKKAATKELSLDERIRHIRDAWQAQFSARDAYMKPSVGIDPWPEEVFEDRITVSTPRGLLAYPYTIGEEGVVEFGEPMQVKAHKDEEPDMEVVQGALARFFESLTGFVTEAVQKVKARENVTILGWREAAQGGQEKHEVGERREESVFIPVVKGKDGADWWLAFSGTAFEDLECEIISRKAIDFGIAYGDETGERGDLRLFHLPNSRVGSCEVQLREGCFLVEAGRWDETDVAVATKETLGRNPEAWKMSVGFAYNEDYFENGVYTDQVVFLERSIVKANRAASPFTAILVSQEADKMSTREDLLELLGDEDKVNAVLALAARKTDELSQLVAFKQKSDDGADVPASEGVMAQLDELDEEILKQLQEAIGAKLRGGAQEGTKLEGAEDEKVGPSVVEISEDVIKAIAAEVALAVDFDKKLMSFDERLGALAKTVEEQGSTVVGVKQLLETDIDGEVNRRLEALPTSRFVLAEKGKLYRQSKDAPDGDAPPMPVAFKSPLIAFGQVYDAMRSTK